VQALSALTSQGIEVSWQAVIEYRNLLEHVGEISSRRTAQSCAWMWSETADELLTELKENKLVMALAEDLEREVKEGLLPPTVAAKRLIQTFSREIRNRCELGNKKVIHDWKS
jgi:LAO/AO transport system kinase